MFVPITLKNTSDLALFRFGFLEKENIREIKLDTTFKDDWKCRLVISKEIQKLLKLPIKVSETVFYDDKKEYYVEMAEALELEIENRKTTVCPFVMPNLQIPVIGSVLLGELSLQIDSNKKELSFLDRKLRI